MRSQPVSAKVSRPRLFDVVPRERLFALLDGNDGRPLVWIAAPPGAGKTTLVASWLEARGHPCLWYQVEAEDVDPASLYEHLGRAADAFGPAGDGPLPRFAAEHLSEATSFARLFFRALFERLPQGMVLVLDNYQDVPDDAPMHAIIGECVRQAPPGRSIMALSRVAAPPAFVQFAARGAMTTLGWHALRVTHAEAVAICAQRGVTEGWLVQALHQQSQGWAAGITLMLERIDHSDGDARELPAETRESVFHYFASLIFDDASEATRRILCSLAFLPRATASLAVAMSGDPAAGALLEDLYRRRLFTDRRPGPEPVYQFHALFVDFLRERAVATFAMAELALLVERSAIALAAAGEVDSAMALWLSHRRWNDARRLLHAEAAGCLRSGRRQTLLRWIDAMPESEQQRDPWLAYWRGRALLQTDPEGGTRVLDQALLAFREQDDRAGALDCLATLVGGAFLGFHAIEAMDRWIDELLAEIDRSDDGMSPDFELRVRGVLCVALFHARPWSPATEAAYLRVEELLPHCRDPAVALGAVMGALVISGLTGDFERGDRLADIATGLASPEAASPSEAAWCFAQVGWLRFVEGRYEDALDCLAVGGHIAASNGLRTVLRAIAQWRCTVTWRLGRRAATDQALAEVESIRGPTQPMQEASLLVFKSRQAGDRGLYDDSARLAILAHEWSLRTGSRLQEVVFGVTCADMLLEAGRADAAATVIERVRPIVQRSPLYGCFRAAVSLLDARLAQTQGQRESAILHLRLALAEAQVGNARYYFRFADRSMSPLFCLALDEGIEVQLVCEVIGLMRLRPPPDAPSVWPWPVRILTLGRFEVQVNGSSLQFPRKLPRKTLLLLKAIIALGGTDVPEQALCDALWGDEDGDAAANALAITIVRLRKLLGGSETIANQGGLVSLNSGLAWVDAVAFERGAVTMGAPDTEAWLQLYGGTFLSGDQNEPWSVPMRERLRGRFIDALSRYSETLESAGDPEAAIAHYLRGVDADPVVEAFHRGLMRCYARTGRRSEAMSAYRRMRQTLSVVLGVPPSEASRQLYCQLVGDQMEEGGQAPSAGQVVVFERPGRKLRGHP